MDNMTSHFILVPWLAQGHMIPMIDIAHLLAGRGAIVSITTTPANIARIQPAIDRIAAAHLPIHFIPLPFPSSQFGLPEGCENLDSIPSSSLIRPFYDATKLLKQPLTDHLRNPNTPAPNCIISDVAHVWTVEIAREFQIPRLVFQGYSCFSLLCTHNLTRFETLESVLSDSDPFLLPGLPHRIQITRPLLPRQFHASPQYPDIFEEITASGLKSDGLVVNSFDELESGYSVLLERSTERTVWMIGPVSLNNGSTDLAERGNKSSIDSSKCLNWLESKSPKSVVYVCFGSMGRFGPSQLIELGSGLLGSNQNFIWVVKSAEKLSDEFENWLAENFASNHKCLLIRGWAPQAMILSHRSVGGFVTHCGWNSTLEGVTAGVPMVTWPLFAEQFLNEKLVVEVLRVGVAVGVKNQTDWADQGKDEVAVGREKVAKAVEMLMEGGGEGEERRRRAAEFGEMAKSTVEKGGSSYLNLSRLVDYGRNYGSGKDDAEK